MARRPRQLELFPSDEPPELVKVVRRRRPRMVERHEAEVAMQGQTYEEAKWATLSPTFRDAHNRLRQQRGMPPIPPPRIDLYKPPLQRQVDPKDVAVANGEAIGAARQFLGGGLMAPGEEGFTIDGKKVRF